MNTSRRHTDCLVRETCNSLRKLFPGCPILLVVVLNSTYRHKDPAKEAEGDFCDPIMDERWRNGSSKQIQNYNAYWICGPWFCPKKIDHIGNKT